MLPWMDDSFCEMIYDDDEVLTIVDPLQLSRLMMCVILIQWRWKMKYVCVYDSNGEETTPRLFEREMPM